MSENITPESVNPTEKSLRNAIASLEASEIAQRFLNHVIDKEGANVAVARFHQIYDGLMLRNSVDKDTAMMLQEVIYDYKQSNREKLSARSEITKRRTFIKMMAGLGLSATSGVLFNNHKVEQDTTGREAHPVTSTAEGLMAVGSGGYAAVQIYKGLTQPDAGTLDQTVFLRSLSKVLEHLILAYEKESERANGCDNAR